MTKAPNASAETSKIPTVPSAADGVTVLDGGKLWVAVNFQTLLATNGLDTFEKIMTCSAGEVARSFPGRNTVRLELKHPGGKKGWFYLKRYEQGYLPLWRILLRALRWPGADDEARREWHAALTLRAAGFVTAIPVAAGQARMGGVVTRSFVMTAEIAGGVCAHNALPAMTTAQRRALARATGELARRFHATGLVHKDFYLYHLFVIHAASHEIDPTLALIDLQRVARPFWFKERWRVKDLAALAYSALKVGVPRTDLARFFQVYRGSARLNAADKQLARSVLKRVRWLNRRRPKHDHLVVARK